jgi:hypothetical protein
MGDADEATTALIAQMLAEDQAAAYGVDQYGLYQDDSGDSDYGGGGKRRKGARCDQLPSVSVTSISSLGSGAHLGWKKNTISLTFFYS